MGNRIKRAKRWIIKKAGGYTPEEYLVRERETKIIHVSPYQMREVKAELFVRNGEFGISYPEDFFKNELAHRLAKALMPYIKIEKRRLILLRICSQDQ